MPLTRTSRDAAAAYALGLIGRTRDRLPVPWTASPSMDDCAAFCSHVLWGGKPGPVLWVDNFKTAGDGSYAAGSRDLAPWDVLLFDWDGNGVGNHVEFMVADLGNGTVRTYGANGADTRAAAYRIRPKRYILGRFRPAWSGAPLVHTTTAPPAPLKESPDMYTIHDKDTGHVFALGQEYVQHLGREGDPALFAAITTVNDEVQHLSHVDVIFAFNALGVPEPYVDAALLRKERPDGLWSRQIENNDLLRRVVAKVGA